MIGSARRRLVVALAIALTLLAATLTAVPATAAPSCPGQQPGTSPIHGLVKGAHPVILVHGWNGGLMQGTRTLLEKQMTPGWQFLLFDYRKSNQRWASDPTIASCLAHYVLDVSNAHRNVGGDGIVYLVGHSMGGLAISFALGPTYGGVSATPAVQSDLASRVGGVVTLDTPFTGSFWGDQVWAAVVDAFNRIKNRELLHILPPPGAIAWQCLKKHRPTDQLNANCPRAPYLTDGIPLDQIAGEATVSRSFLGFHAYDIPLQSDTVVDTASQHGYVGSAPGTRQPAPAGVESVLCRADADQIIHNAIAAGLVDVARGPLVTMLMDNQSLDGILNGHLTPGMAEFLALGQTVLNCSHTNITTNQRAIDLTAQALRRFAGYSHGDLDVTSYGSAHFTDPTGKIWCSLTAKDPRFDDRYYQEQAECVFPKNMPGYRKLPQAEYAPGVVGPPNDILLLTGTEFRYSTGQEVFPLLNSSNWTVGKKWFKGTGFSPVHYRFDSLDASPNVALLAAVPYGHSLVLGHHRCDVTYAGVSCRDTETGNGFTVSIDHELKIIGDPARVQGS